MRTEQMKRLRTALPRCSEPVETASAQGAFSHNLSPSQWLAVYQDLTGRQTEAIQIGIAGANFDLGLDALTSQTQSACLQLVEGLEGLVVERFRA